MAKAVRLLHRIMHASEEPGHIGWSWWVALYLDSWHACTESHLVMWMYWIHHVAACAKGTLVRDSIAGWFRIAERSINSNWSFISTPLEPLSSRGVKQPLNCMTIELHTYSIPYLPAHFQSIFYSIKRFLIKHRPNVLISPPLSIIPPYHERLISSISIDINMAGRRTES